MNEIEQMEARNRARLDFDVCLAKLQRLLAEIHKHGGKDVVQYREVGNEAEIYRERID